MTLEQGNHAQITELARWSPTEAGDTVTYSPARPQGVVDLWRAWAEAVTP